MNVTSQTTDDRTVNLTAKSDIPHEIADGKLVFLVLNADPIAATYAGNGTWWALHTFDTCGEFEVNASVVGVYNVTVSNATITVNKIQTQLAANPVTATYNVNQYLVITLKDANGKPISGAKVTVALNGAKTYTTNKNGQVKVSTKSLAPKKYSAKVTFNGNANYVKSTKTIKVTVKKAIPKLTAKKKTFKKSVKVKKYTITLKYGKTALKKVKVYIKIKGKKYTAKTNSKGKATFKIKKLTKKGTFKSKITFKGNKYYNKVTKTVKIKIK